MPLFVASTQQLKQQKYITSLHHTQKNPNKFHYFVETWHHFSEAFQLF